MKVFGGVLVLGGVAATDMSTDQAQAQMDPSVSHFQAFFATVFAGCPKLDLVQMCALFSHECSSRAKLPRIRH